MSDDIPQSFDDGFYDGLDGKPGDTTKQADPSYVTGYKFGLEARPKSEVDASPPIHADFKAGFHAGLADARAGAVDAVNGDKIGQDKNEHYKSGYSSGYDPSLLSTAKRAAARRVSARVASRADGGKTTRRKRKRSKKSRRRKQKK